MLAVEQGEKIRLARIAKGLTQKEVAELLCMSDKNYSKIELGQVNLSADNISRLCQILGLSEIELLADRTIRRENWEKYFFKDMAGRFNGAVNSENAGVVLGLKNGNTFVDGGIKVEFEDGVHVFSCYPIYVNADNRIIDEDNNHINNMDIFVFEKRMRELNPKLRIDATMTSGYCESEDMARLLTRLNTRGSHLDVFWH